MTQTLEPTSTETTDVDVSRPNRDVIAKATARDPKEAGMKVAAFADAGSLWDYQGAVSRRSTGEILSCPPGSSGPYEPPR